MLQCPHMESTHKDTQLYTIALKKHMVWINIPVYKSNKIQLDSIYIMNRSLFEHSGLSQMFTYNTEEKLLITYN